MSFTYYTDATRQRELLYRGNARLRRLGIAPHPVGSSPGRDRVKRAVITGYTTAKNAVWRALGRSFRDTGLPYAPVQRNSSTAGLDAM
jgi:hypothetical protein